MMHVGSVSTVIQSPTATPSGTDARVMTVAILSLIAHQSYCADSGPAGVDGRPSVVTGSSRSKARRGGCYGRDAATGRRARAAAGSGVDVFSDGRECLWWTYSAGNPDACGWRVAERAPPPSRLADRRRNREGRSHREGNCAAKSNCNHTHHFDEAARRVWSEDRA